MRRPHDRAGGEPREEQPASTALAVHFARIGEQEHCDEAAQSADRSCEEDELRIVHLQDLRAGEEQAGLLVFGSAGIARPQ